MAFRSDEIGNRLRAYRMGSGLSADEIAKQLGISRTALYRFEKGELAKIDTLDRLAELLGVSIPTLLGVGIEYIPSAVSYFERVRQMEETAEHIVVLAGPISFLLASDTFLPTLQEVLTENIRKHAPERSKAMDDIPKIIDILHARKRCYRERTPHVVNLISALEIERFLSHGFIGRAGLSDSVIAKRKALARKEIEHFANLIEDQPMGVQIGIVLDTLPQTGFQLIRQPDKRCLVLSPFRLGGEPNVSVGVAMITSAPDAVSLHEKSVSEMWSRALKGPAALACIRHLLDNARAGKPIDVDDFMNLLPQKTRVRNPAL